ncbi:MAG: hypothetical protein KY468_17140 [Armatimonadetes bacterium]|nr:hypothetical protein [Armatimonadota bacterium]
MKRGGIALPAVLLWSVLLAWGGVAFPETAPPPPKLPFPSFNVRDPRWGATYSPEGAMTNFTPVVRRVLQEIKATRKAHGYGVWDARVILPRGRYEADGTIDVVGMKGLTISGETPYGVHLSWNGPSYFGSSLRPRNVDAITPLFFFGSSADVRVENLSISASPDRPLDCIFQMANIGTLPGEAEVSATAINFRRCHADGTRAYGIHLGWQWAGPTDFTIDDRTGLPVPAGSKNSTLEKKRTALADGRAIRYHDANNDLSSVEHSSVLNCSRAGASIEHSQSLTHWFRQWGANGASDFDAPYKARDASGKPVTRYPRVMPYGIRCLSGSFRHEGGGIGYARRANYLLLTPSEGYNIHNTTSEDSRAFLRVGVPWCGDAQSRIAVTGHNRFDCNRIYDEEEDAKWDGTAKHPSDGNYVIEAYWGTLHLQGITFGGGELPYRPRAYAGPNVRHVISHGTGWAVRGSENLNPWIFDDQNGNPTYLKVIDLRGEIFPGAGVILENRAVPPVFRGSAYVMQPGEDVTITDMEGKYFGKELTLRGNGTRRIAHNRHIRLKSTEGGAEGRTPAQGAMVRFIYNGDLWEEL